MVFVLIVLIFLVGAAKQTNPTLNVAELEKPRSD